jgi:hypothetical protein
LCCCRVDAAAGSFPYVPIYAAIVEAGQVVEKQNQAQHMAQLHLQLKSNMQQARCSSEQQQTA